jgi:hypothetical protein
MPWKTLRFSRKGFISGDDLPTQFLKNCSCKSDCAILNLTDTFCQISTHHRREGFASQIYYSTAYDPFLYRSLRKAMRGEGEKRKTHRWLVAGRFVDAIALADELMKGRISNV